MGNVRGNTYSRRRVNSSVTDFWDFSFDEISKHDIPAMIDYVLNVTKETQLFYIGHSQGTTVAFALLSENPDFNKKIKLFIALAPVATVGYITSPIRYLAPLTHELDFLLHVLGLEEFLPSNALVRFLAEYGCDPPTRALCEHVMFLFTGTDLQELNATRIGVYLSHIPAGTSTKNVVHFAQMIESKKFQKYDYGVEGNKLRYNQPSPPEYDVSRIPGPLALVWSMNDAMADPADVGLLRDKLQAGVLVSDYCVRFPLFNHGDFVLAVDAKRMVYDHVLDLLAGKAPPTVPCS